VETEAVLATSHQCALQMPSLSSSSCTGPAQHSMSDGGAHSRSLLKLSLSRLSRKRWTPSGGPGGHFLMGNNQERSYKRRENLLLVTYNW